MNLFEAQGVIFSLIHATLKDIKEFSSEEGKRDLT